MSGIDPSLVSAHRARHSEAEASRINLREQIQQAMTTREHPNVALLDFAADRFDLLQASCELSIPVQWQLLHAITSDKTPQGCIFQGNDFGFAHLSSSEIVDLYNVLNQYRLSQGASSIFFAHLFDITDHLLRRSVHSQSEAIAILQRIDELHDETLLPLRKKIVGLAPTGSFTPRFHSLIKKNAELAGSRWDDYAIIKRESTSPKSPLKLKVVKVALETSRNAVGGLGAVLKASGAAHRALGHESVHGIHAFYTHDKARIPAAFKGVILHEYNGEMVESSVYKDTETGDYLIQPPTKYRSLFDVGSSAQLYAVHPGSTLDDRKLFLASASAAFIALYHGKSAEKSVDVVQGDAHHVAGPLFELMATKIDYMIENAGLYRSARTYLTHMLTGCKIEQGTMPTGFLDRIGCNTLGYDDSINATASALIHADAKIFVSEGVRDDALSEDERKSAGLRAPLLTHGKETVFRGLPDIHGLTNGIDTSTFDISNPREFKRFALHHRIEDGAAVRDFVAHQAEIKDVLASQNLIADPKKPLFLFVGRYSSEKGIDMLPAMAEAAIREGGQCVIMGLKCEDQGSIAIIEDLKARANSPPFNGLLKVYTERDDQMGTLKLGAEGEDDTGVRKGWLLRSAASAVMVPSHAEACGLVPMEAHCTGSLIIAPSHQGLVDMCVPITTEDSPGGRDLFEGGNSFMYTHHDSFEEATWAVVRAARFIQRLAPDQLNRYMQLTHDYAVTTYGWLNMNESTGVISGTAVNYSKVYHEVYHRLHPDSRGRVESFEEAILRIRQTKKLETSVAGTAAGSSEIDTPIENPHKLLGVFFELLDPGAIDECKRVLELISTMEPIEGYEKYGLYVGIRDLFAKITNHDILVSAEDRIEETDFFKKALSLLFDITRSLSYPLTSKQELALLQLAQSGELCGSGILDNLQQCHRLLRNETEPLLLNFVQNCLKDHEDAFFDATYSLFLAGRPDSSHPRQALRLLFDSLINQEDPATKSIFDPFLDKTLFNEFATPESLAATCQGLRSAISYSKTEALAYLIEKLEKNDDQRSQLVDWFKSHIPGDFTTELSEEEALKLSELNGVDAQDFLAHLFLSKKVYNMDTGHLNTKAVLYYLQLNCAFSL